MQTVRQIERLWNANQFSRLFNELIANRPEASFGLAFEPRSAAAAAIALIRLDELNQPHVPLYGTLLRALIASQDRDGGWGDASLTALCIRALMLGKNTSGDAIEKALIYLQNLQRIDGLWPKGPFRRMPGDVTVSAFVLYELGDELRFRDAVRFNEVVKWFDGQTATMETSARRLWDRASLRCRTRRGVREPMMVWS